jgi:Flp pilus assembly protein TadD
VVIVAGIAVAAGAVLVGRTSLADHYRDQGERALAKDPVYALQKARDSLALNDESLPTYYLRSAAWARLGDYPRARSALLEATRREPHDFVPWALLGDLAMRRGDRAVARSDYRHSSRLNPRDRSIAALAATGRGP